MVRCLYGDGDDDEEDNVLVVALLATNLYNIHLTQCKCDGGLSRTLHDIYRWLEVSEKHFKDAALEIYKSAKHATRQNRAKRNKSGCPIIS